MRRINTLLAAAQLCAATRHGFSIHHDLLAFPQFEVVLSDTYISEPEAKALLGRGSRDSASVDEKEIQAATPIAASSDGRDGASETYEIMTTHDTRYLCAIPVIEAPPAQNKTETELAKAEEARELARASAHGWELVNALDGTCLYYVSGWWSYSFCYGHDVVQFHATPSKGGPPQRDPNSQEYVLGRVQDPSSTSGRRGRKNSKTNTPAPANNEAAKPTTPPPNTELQVKGDQRYLVQRMEDGTVCDLTNRPRTIEIQYHCSPGSTQDRIGWIKEVTTCTYLMLVNTPRLCSDVAFQPPAPSRANVVSCRTIVPEAQQAEWHAQKTLEAKAAMIGQQRKDAAQTPVTIGGVVVGGRQIIGKGEDGKDAPQLKAPRNFGKDAPIVEIIALGNTDEDGKLEVLSDEELEKLDIDPKLVEQLKKQIEELAGDNGWKLEVVEQPGQHGREIRGVIDTENDKDDEEGNGEDQAKAQGEDEEKGSEEKFFKEEL
ncbi:putative Glucosidase II beta subunit-like protein-domain-containing protein [Seiridium cardinale]